MGFERVYLPDERPRTQKGTGKGKARDGNAVFAAGGHERDQIRGSSHAVAEVDHKHAKHQTRWAADDDEGLAYRMDNGLVGRTHGSTKQLSCYAWRLVRHTDLYHPVFVQARFERVRLLIERWVEFQEYRCHHPRGHYAHGGHPTVELACWWPYFTNLIDRLGPNTSCAELDVFDWGLYDPAHSTALTPRGGWPAWCDSQVAQGARPADLPDLEERMREELRTVWSHAPIPPHRRRGA